MESATQLDLLKNRIEYDERIFGKGVTYYEFTNNEENYLYTLDEIPNVGDMTYLFVDEEMIADKAISSVNTHEEIVDGKTIIVLDSIVVESETYTPTNVEKTILETYIKVLKRLLDDSKYIALSLRFPYEDYSEMELPKKYNNWQLRCCVELYQNIGREGIKSYAENGLSWTRDTDYISYGLKEEIEPKVGVIRPEEEEDSNE